MASDDFTSSRESVIKLAVAGGAVTLTGLILLEVFKKDLWTWVSAAGTNILGVLFGLAVVSLVWEFFVRRTHSADLRHYLRLGASVAQSGLQEVTSRSKLDWPDILGSANEVTVLTYSAEWLDRNDYVLRDIATTRALSVTVAVPIRGGAFMLREAELRGVSSDKIADSIAETVARGARLWRDANNSQTPLHAGSKLSIVEHDIALGYEVVTVDRTTIVTLAAPGDIDEILDRVAFVYQQSAEQYPTSFFTSHTSKLAEMNRLDEVSR
jgi:hypothetical protein